MTSKREKSVVLTPREIDYLALQREATRAIEEELRAELGEASVLCAEGVLDALDAGEGVVCGRTCVVRPTSSPSRNNLYGSPTVPPKG